CTIDWSRVLPGGGRVVSLPPYAWQRERYWAEVGDFRPGGRRTQGGPDGSGGSDTIDLLGRQIRSSALTAVVFESVVSAQSPGFLRDHQIHGTVLFPAAGYLAMAHRGLSRMNGGAAVQVEQ